MKIIVAIILSFLSLLAEEKGFLDPKEAFTSQIKQDDKNIIFELKTGKNIYVYHDKLKIIITKPQTTQPIDLTKEIQLPTPEIYNETKVFFNNIVINVPKKLLNEKLGEDLIFKFQGCSKSGLCYQPMQEKIALKSLGLDATIDPKNTSQKTQTTDKTETNETDAIAKTLMDGNIFLVLGTFFGFGLLLALTPCVFPMIPILSSIIVSHSGGGKKMNAAKGFWLSGVYVLAMSVAYTIAGILAGLFGANLQAALQNPVVLVAFAGIFVALAFSMFGFYKLELPQSLQSKLNKTTHGKEKNGIVGIAIMGFLSALIVGPCVAPPLAGALVYIGQTGDAALGGAALFVMSLGMGAPLLAVGAGAGKFMPRPGGWMDTVSKIFGVVMLGVAIWMIERIIPPMATMILWSLFFMGCALYFILKRRKAAFVFAIPFFIYGYLLAMGAGSGAKNPLNPVEYLGEKTNTTDENIFKQVKSVSELEKILASSSKPIMLDFYADWCVSCKELEHTTFKDKRVLEKLKDFTLLQVDTTNNTDNDKELLAKFNLFGPPGIVFWRKNGKESEEIKGAKIVGYKNPDEFLSHMERFFDLEK